MRSVSTPYTLPGREGGGPNPNPSPNPDPYLTGADLNPAMRLPGQASAPTNQLQPLSNPTRDEGAGEKLRL